MVISELKQLEVVNLTDGKILGNVSDIMVNLSEGRIEAIIVPGNGRIGFFMSSRNEYIIPWSDIKKIGEEVLLVTYRDLNI